MADTDPKFYEFAYNTGVLIGVVLLIIGVAGIIEMLNYLE